MCQRQALQLGIELRSDLGDDAGRLVLRKPRQEQDLVGEREAGGEVLREHDRGAGFGHARQLALVGRADDRDQVGTVVARAAQQARDRPSLVERDHQQPRAREPGPLQDAGPAGVGEDDFVAQALRLSKPGQIRLEADVGGLHGLEDDRHWAADASAAAQDDVILQRLAAVGDRVLLLPFARGDGGAADEVTPRPRRSAGSGSGRRPS